MTAVTAAPGPTDVGSGSDAGPLVHCRDLVHVYQAEGADVAALRGVDLDIRAGESVALLGPSGSGKTTLLWHLAGLLSPTAGTVEVAGQSLVGLSAQALGRFRRDRLGIVLQGPGRNLLPYDTALGNVLFAATSRSRRSPSHSRPSRGSTRDRAQDLLASVGLASLADHRAGRLSGGEQQRLALAVALANEPALLLADEPTSQLDPRAADSVLELLSEAGERWATTVLAVTHDPAVAASLGRTVSIADGRVSSVGVAGREHLVVGRDGSVVLPTAALAELPAGSAVRAVVHPGAVELRRVQPAGSPPSRAVSAPPSPPPADHP